MMLYSCTHMATVGVKGLKEDKEANELLQSITGSDFRTRLFHRSNSK